MIAANLKCVDDKVQSHADSPEPGSTGIGRDARRQHPQRRDI